MPQSIAASATIHTACYFLYEQHILGPLLECDEHTQLIAIAPIHQYQATFLEATVTET